MEDKLLYDNEWIQVKETEGGYVYTHCPKTDGKVVAVLGYDFSDPQNEKLLARFEDIPCHRELRNKKGMNLTCVMGMIDDEVFSSEETALKELYEEANVLMPINSFIPLGKCYPAKSGDSLVHMFAVDLAGQKVEGTPEGDGTEGEVGSYAKMVNAKDYLNKVETPLVGLMYCRLKNILGE